MADVNDDKGDGQDTVKQQELQKRFMEYQVQEQQIKQMQQQLEKLEQQTAEVSAVLQSIDDLGRAEKDSEILVPVSGGIFFPAQMKDNQRFLVNVGSGVVVEKDLDGVKALVGEQAKEIEKYRDHMTAEMGNRVEKFQEMEQELKKLIED